jgi:hypothetical protein
MRVPAPAGLKGSARGGPPQERDTAKAMHQATQALTRCMVERGFALGVPHPTRGM